MSFEQIWNAQDEEQWNQLLRAYWSLVKLDHIQVELLLHRLTPERVSGLDAEQWYRFLHDEYFVWKYTAPNRLKTTRTQLRRYMDEGLLSELDDIRVGLLKADPEDIQASLATASRVRGLGTAGASGLLSLIYPEYFATVDQFVVRALLDVSTHRPKVKRMNPENLSVADGVVLTEMMRAKAAEMNAKFGSLFWTPRTVEMALWAYRDL